MSDRTTAPGGATSTATAISPVEEVTTPAAPGGPAPVPEPTPRRRPAALFAALRWTAAAVVFGALGTTVAYAVTDRDRTDIPTLATQGDGRWTYPPLARPTLPVGAEAPFSAGNRGQIHYADLEQLLLPAPEGSRPDPALAAGKGGKSRVPVSRFLQEYAEDTRGSMAADLRDNGLRHIAARGWTMTDDGTSTRVYLLRFNSSASQLFFFGTYLRGTKDAPQRLRDVEKLSSAQDHGYEAAGVTGTDTYFYDEIAPRGPVHVRHAYTTAGDTVALVVQSRKGSLPAVPFDQTVILQNQLLG
ncbi:hypothetical protein ACGFMO_19860 [Streptomyces niveus]|uniref:hypothetical protein n=1 Tax=Streptomyces niveus TaxID=193462 RepID=UPI003714AA28